MDLFYFTSAVHGLSNIQSKQLKIAMFSDANDPYELESITVTTNNDKLISERLKRLSSAMGIICFSESCSETLMWSHYAQHHTGMALQFDMTSEFEDGSEHGHPVRKVHYSNERLNFSELTTESHPENRMHEFFLKSLTTKSQSWSYEKEWRKPIFLDQMSGVKQSDDGKLFFYKFDRWMKLSAVLLGSKCAIRPFKVHEALGSAGLEADVFTMKADLKTFDIVKDGKFPPKKSN